MPDALHLSADTALPPAMVRRQRIFLLFWLAAAFVVCVVSVWAHMQIGLDNDHLVLMDQVRKLLAGATPYVDYTDVSPPLIHLIYIVPVLLSRAMELPLYVSLYAMTFTLIALALIASARMLRHSGVKAGTRWITLIALALALLTASFIHQPFADREHLMMVLAAPWFVLHSPLVRRESVPIFWRLLAAAMAAVGFAIKPYFYVFYAATFCFEWYSRRSLRAVLRQPEHHVVWGFALGYIAIVFTFFRQYIFTILPIGLQTYKAISWSWDSKLDVIGQELLGGYGVMGLLGILVLCLAAPGLYDRLLTYLLVLLLAALGSYGLNGGWYYTQYPFIAISLVLTIAVGSRLIFLCLQRRQPVVIAAVTGLLLAGLGHFYVQPVLWRAGWDIRQQRDHGHPLSTFDMESAAAAKLDQHFAIHPRFIFLTTNLWSVNLLKEGTPRENVSRFDYLWPLPGILDIEQNPSQQRQAAELTEYLSGSLADDITRHRPDMVIEDVSPERRSLPAAYRMVAWLMKNPRFAKAWENYRLADSIDACTPQAQANCAYKVYYRK